MSHGLAQDRAALARSAHTVHARDGIPVIRAGAAAVIARHAPRRTGGTTGRTP